MATGSEVSDWSVNDVIRRYPATVDLFNRYGIDACCGGAASVADAARRDGADRALLLDLQTAITREAS